MQNPDHTMAAEPASEEAARDARERRKMQNREAQRRVRQRRANEARNSLRMAPITPPVDNFNSMTSFASEGSPTPLGSEFITSPLDAPDDGGAFAWELFDRAMDISQAFSDMLQEELPCLSLDDFDPSATVSTTRRELRQMAAGTEKDERRAGKMIASTAAGELTAPETTEARPNQTPLHIAASLGNAPIMRQLLDAGADVDSTDDRRRTSLHYCAEIGHLEGVRLLLRYGAKVHVADRTGRDALTVAIEAEQAPIVSALLQHGANPNARVVAVDKYDGLYK